MAVDKTLISGAATAAKAEMSGLLAKAEGVGKITDSLVEGGTNLAIANEEMKERKALEREEKAKEYDAAVADLMANQGHLSDEAYKETYDMLMKGDPDSKPDNVRLDRSAPGEGKLFRSRQQRQDDRAFRDEVQQDMDDDWFESLSPRDKFINGDKADRAVQLRTLERQAKAYESFVDQREAFSIKASGDMLASNLFDLPGNEEARDIRDALVGKDANLVADPADGQYKLRVGDKYYNNAEIEAALKPFDKPVDAIDAIAQLQTQYADNGANAEASFNENSVRTNVKNTIIKGSDSKALAYSPILGGGNGNSFYDDLVNALQGATYSEFGIGDIEDPTPGDGITQEDAVTIANGLVNSDQLDDYLANYITRSFRNQFVGSREGEVIEGVNNDYNDEE